MAEGRCSLSSYATGQSPNMHGACSPASHVEYDRNDGRLASRARGLCHPRAARGQPAPYPTVCKGFYPGRRLRGHVFEDPVSLDAAELIPELAEGGRHGAEDRRPPAQPRLCRGVVAPFAARSTLMRRANRSPPATSSR